VPGFAMDIGVYDNPSVSDAADNLTQLRGVTFSGNIDNQITADSNGSAYGYDLDGNATTEEGIQVQYDDAGQLTFYNDPLTKGYLDSDLPEPYEINEPSHGLFLTES
jgi:hypothetical protein